MLPLIFSVSCGQIKDPEELGNTLGEVQALEATKAHEYPADCRRTSRAGLDDGDDLLEAIGKYDAALVRQNRRTLNCAKWYDDNVAE